MRRAISKTLAIVIAAIIVIAGVGVVAYLAMPGGSTGGTVSIGVLLPLTGQDAYSGQQMQQGALMAQAYLNDNGGILGKTVKVVIKDDKSDLPTATQAATDLVTQSNVIALAGFYKSFITTGVYQSVSTKYNILTFTAGWVDALTNPNNTLMFRAGPDEAMQITQWAQFIEMVAQKTGHTKLAMYSEDDDYGHGFQDPLAAALQADGKVQVVFNKYHDYQATDFTADLANVKSSGANLFWTSTVSSNVMTMIKQAYTIGLSNQAVMMTVADGFYYTSEYATTVGTAGDHVIITSFHKPGTNYTSLTPSMDAYYSKLGYGSQVSYYITMQVFEDILLIADAANKAGSTSTQSMVNALETNTFTGPWGAINFPTTANGYHQWTPSMLFEQYQSLTLKIIYPTAVAEAQMILPSG